MPDLTDHFGPQTANRQPPTPGLAPIEQYGKIKRNFKKNVDFFKKKNIFSCLFDILSFFLGFFVFPKLCILRISIFWDFL